MRMHPHHVPRPQRLLHGTGEGLIRGHIPLPPAAHERAVATLPAGVLVGDLVVQQWPKQGERVREMRLAYLARQEDRDARVLAQQTLQRCLLLCVEVGSASRQLGYPDEDDFQVE